MGAHLLTAQPCQCPTSSLPCPFSWCYSRFEICCVPVLACFTQSAWDHLLLLSSGAGHSRLPFQQQCLHCRRPGWRRGSHMAARRGWPALPCAHTRLQLSARSARQAGLCDPVQSRPPPVIFLYKMNKSQTKQSSRFHLLPGNVKSVATFTMGNHICINCLPRPGQVFY